MLGSVSKMLFTRSGQSSGRIDKLQVRIKRNYKWILLPCTPGVTGVRLSIWRRPAMIQIICKTDLFQFYRLLLMHSNQCFTIMLSPREEPNTELETWLREQCGQESDER